MLLGAKSVLCEPRFRVCSVVFSSRSVCNLGCASKGMKPPDGGHGVGLTNHVLVTMLRLSIADLELWARNGSHNSKLRLSARITPDMSHSRVSAARPCMFACAPPTATSPLATAPPIHLTYSDSRLRSRRTRYNNDACGFSPADGFPSSPKPDARGRANCADTA